MKKNVLRSIVLAMAISLLVPAIAINGYSWFKTYDTEVNKSTVKFAEKNVLALTLT